MSRLETINLDAHKVEHLYHMTHIDNLPFILQHGLLAHGNGYQKKDISNQDVNSRRSRRDPVYRKPLHSYVPFYFNPRNAMLYVQEDQSNIVILEVSRELILKKGALFTDGNAASGDTSFSNDLSELDIVDWKCVAAKYWGDYRDGKRKKMAEVLVPDRVGIKQIEAIACNNEKLQNKIDKLTKGTINSFIDYNLYF